MIEVKINGVAKWQVNEYTFNDPQMGIRSINMTVKHPSMWVDGTAPDTADFTGAYVDYEGEKYSISSSKPTAEKSNTSLDFIYTLIFKGEEDELTRRKVRNLALVSFDNYVSQGTTFSIYADINQFKQLLENNLKHYFGNKWSINLSVLSSDSVRIDVSNVTLWDLLSKTYEYFGVRFNIRGNVINIGYEPEDIYHVFDYGNDGGLVKITKTAPDTSIVNRLSGMGGSRNVPTNYFTDRYSEFAPDPNPINSSVNIRNIMPKVFRDSVVLGDYKDYVEDLASIASHGVREDALAPNEDIYPSIAGVEVSGLGRIDEIIAVSEVIADKPDDENYSPTFHIWVKDIGFNLADEQYTSTQDAKISFTTGALTGYEFTILANGKIREVVEDTTKSFNGVSSKYRITLINSDEDFDATGRVLPNTVLKPSAGDHFVIYDIEMPFSYVANAEQRVQDWLEANLADLKEEKPTFSIEPMSSFFETAPVEFDGKTIKEKLRAGNKITINADVEHRLHINNLTIQYGGLIPKYSFTVTDKVQVQGGTVARMQSQLDGVMSRQLLTERDIETLLSGFSTKYLSKVKPDIAQQFISFLKGISVKDLVYLAEGLEIGTFSSGVLGSGAAIKMLNGTSYAEVDHLTVRQKATFRELIIESLKHIGGQLVLSPARMKCNKVVDGGTYYKCYFDTGDGEVSNEFVAGDQARCQVFTGSGTKFYWRLVTSVGEDWINLSKTDAVAGSDVPAPGDDISQLGNRTDITRQNAQILSTVGIDAPSWKQYAGINSFSLGEEKIVTEFTRLGNRIQGKTVFTSGGSNLDDYLDSTAQDIEDAQAAANAAALKAQQAIDEAEANVGLINTEVGKLQAQIDGEVSNWFYPYSPTLANYPASDWTTNAIKDRHIGDTFTSIAQAPATDAGKSWRFVKNGSTYSWTVIADSDAVKALLEASKAQATADGKSTTFLITPSNYKLGDMWVLNADQTVNGTAYKSGEILTATQDSTTFVQAHWIKRVRYTDDSAVNNLEIGGVNLLELNSSKWEQGGISSTGIGSGDQSSYARIRHKEYFPCVSSFDYTVKKHSSLGKIVIVFYDENKDRIINRGWFTTEGVISSPSNAAYFRAVLAFEDDSNITLSALSSLKFKLEKGTKATDWSPATEDVEAEINQAKQEALNAANSVQTNVNSLNTYVTGAFKDGLIDEAEAKAIEKYKNTINETMVKAEASFAKVFANNYLEGTAKTALENAKINLWGQRDTLLSTINTAIADGKTTIAEKNAVDSAFNTFNSLMSAFQSALEEANKAIQTKLDTLSTDRVNNLQIGAKNLLIGSKNYSLSNPLFAGSTATDSGMDENFWILTLGSTYLQINIPSRVAIGEKFTFSFIHTRKSLSAQNFQVSYGAENKTFTSNSNTTKSPFTFTKTADNTYLRISRVEGGSGWTLRMDELQLEMGDKATSYSEATEDIQARIDKTKLTAEQAQLQADGYMRARYVRDWLKGNTDHNNNNWSEIKVVNKAGVNLALGKIPTANGTFNANYPAVNITDGDTATQGYIPQTSPTENYVQLDLGQVYYDIDYIGVWHAGWPTRLYYGTKTEISEDGINWTTIFDSAIEGTYKETAEGKIHSQRWAKVMANLNRSKAVTDKFGTLVNGGLISPVTVELREADTMEVTAGHTGIQGSLKNLPAYWAGGTYAEAIAGIAKIIFRHDGTGKIGVFEVDEAGSVNIYDPAITDLLRLEFIKSKVPTVASLMSQTQAEDSVTNVARMFYSSSGSATLPNSVTVTEEGAELSFQGMMELDVSFTELNGAEFGSAAVGVYLYKDGSNYATLGGISAGRIDRDNPYFSSFVQLNKKLTVPKGIYTIVVSGSFSNALGSAGINNTSTLSWILRRDIRRFIFGSDGFASWYTENSFHFSELTGMFARGKVDIPAGLGGGGSAAGGVADNWGRVLNANRVSSTTTINHSIGDLKYTVMVTPIGSSSTWYVQNKTANSVQIVCSGTFDYILVRTPY